MMMRNWMRAAAAMMLAMLFAAPAFAEAADPAVPPVRAFYDVLLDSMKHAGELGVKGRYEKLKPAVERSFDLSGMVRAAVGLKWASFTPDEQHALIAAFERKTVAEYASNFDGYNGEKFIVEPATTARGADKVVLSKLVTGSQTIPFNYRMRMSGGSWKILDIYLNGFVSQLATQRSDFAATLLTGGAASLTRQLNAKADKLLQ
jgi:phospholipid transport system substrate-binding protein